MIAGVEIEKWVIYGSCDHDHAPLGWSVIFRLGYDIVYLCTNLMTSYSHSRDMIGGPENLK